MDPEMLAMLTDMSTTAAPLAAGFVGNILSTVVGAIGSMFGGGGQEQPQQVQQPTFDGNKAAEEAAMKEKQAALARQRQGQSTFTSGLGVAGDAKTQQKKLLGE